MTAIEPATPTLLPPAPDVELAWKLDAAGAVVSTVTVVALRSALWLKKALVVMTATLTETATAMPEFGSFVGGFVVPSGVPLPADPVLTSM